MPSPTAATLHATHYHRVDVRAQQRELAERRAHPARRPADIPLATGVPSAEADRIAELDDNVQSILGYVVRWVDQGIGCSKVPDLSDVALMEDRATLRISSQLLGNWLTHGSSRLRQVDRQPRPDRTARRPQNASDPAYRSLRDSARRRASPIQAARDLILARRLRSRTATPKPILHAYRRRAKEAS